MQLSASLCQQWLWIVLICLLTLICIIATFLFSSLRWFLMRPMWSSSVCLEHCVHWSFRAVWLFANLFLFVIDGFLQDLNLSLYDLLFSVCLVGVGSFVVSLFYAYHLCPVVGQCWTLPIFVWPGSRSQVPMGVGQVKLTSKFDVKAFWPTEFTGICCKKARFVSRFVSLSLV